MGYEKKSPILIYRLKDSDKEQRIKYCELYKESEFDNVIFSDEVIFQLNGNRPKMWYLDEE